MTGLDDLLIGCLAEPQRMVELDRPSWNRVLRLARRDEILPQLSARARRAEVFAETPADVQRHLMYGEQMAVHCQQGIHWEINRIEKALSSFDGPVALLKGAAYVMTGSPAGRGRMMNDVDLLVPKSRIAEAENLLIAAGWEPMARNEYDDHYYREWTHELPPLVHRGRRSMVDVHHNILPPTGRLKPDVDKLLAAARPLPDSRLLVLSPEDMVLHSAAHLFQECDLFDGLRDLADLDSLLRDFAATEPDFDQRLVVRAAELQLSRPLYYAQYFTQRYFHTPFEPEAQQLLAERRPYWPVDRLMKRLTSRVIPVPECDGIPRTTRLAQWLLTVRMHWLKMPPALLIRHTLHKVWMSWRDRNAEA